MSNYNVPKGWKLVPEEPTREMFVAANKADDKAYADGRHHGADNEDIWHAMLAAAPAAPVVQTQPDAALVEALKDLMPNLDGALQDLELFGLHSDQGYRKLKDWYRKMLQATKAVDAALAGKGGE